MEKSQLFHVGEGKFENYPENWADIWAGKFDVNELKLTADAIVSQIRKLASALEKWHMVNVNDLVPILNQYETEKFKLNQINWALEHYHDIEELYELYEFRIPFPRIFENARKYVGVCGISMSGTALIKIGDSKIVYLTMPVFELAQFYKNTDWQKLMFELNINSDIESDNSEISTLFYHQ